MTRVLVTGAGGFIGMPLTKALLAAGLDVIPIKREYGDLAHATTWERIPKADALIHLAGRSYVPDSWRDQIGFMQSNTVATGHALEYCHRHGARLIFVSAYVYGVPSHLPIREDDPVRPNNPYALSKRMAEELCEFYAEYRGVPVTVLRVFNVYGPGQRAEFLIPKIIRQVRTGREIRVRDLNPKRDYIYLDDVVDALVKALTVPGKFTLVNIGSGESLSVREIIDRIQKISGTMLPIHSDGLERQQEIPEVRADISRARSVLGWQPRYGFDAGIQAMLNEE
jgi:GDP-4-dehydro-6-deoxy-D-mannose reductase